MPKGKSYWYKWVRHNHHNIEVMNRGGNRDDLYRLPWRHICGACREKAEKESGMITAPGCVFKQRFWKCDRCGVRRFWHKAYELYPFIPGLFFETEI